MLICIFGVSRHQNYKANATGSKLPDVSFSIETQAENKLIDEKETAVIPLRLSTNE